MKPSVENRPLARVAAALCRLALALCVVLLTLLLSLGGFLWAYQARYQETILPGVSILGVPVGGLSRAQALERLQRALAGRGWLYIILQIAEGAWVVWVGAPDAAPEPFDVDGTRLVGGLGPRPGRQPRPGRRRGPGVAVGAQRRLSP